LQEQKQERLGGFILLVSMTSSSWLYTEDLYQTYFKLNMNFVGRLLDILFTSLEYLVAYFFAKLFIFTQTSRQTDTGLYIYRLVNNLGAWIEIYFTRMLI
jgi:hypothetical protein